MARKKALKQALDYLYSSIGRHTWVDEPHLPSLARLAEAAGVSFSTMRTAVTALKAEGLLDTVKGGFITLAAKKHPYRAHEDKDTQKWQKLRKRIFSDVLDGTIVRNGTLPSIKEMKNHYGVCNQTLRKALDALCEQQIIERFKTTYRFRQTRNRKGMTSILLIGYGARGMAIADPRGNRFMSTLEKECIKSGVRLDIHNLNPLKPAESFAVKPGPRCIGTIFWVSGWLKNSEELRTRLYYLITDIAGKDMPVTVFDDYGFVDIRRFFPRRHNIRIFSIGNTTAGEHIGRFLIESGHTHVAYVARHFDHDWSRQRYEAIKRMFAQAGPQKRVHLYADMPALLNSPETAVAVAGFDAAEYDMLFSTGIISGNRDQVMERHREFCRPLQKFTGFESCRQETRKRLEFLLEIAKEPQRQRRYRRSNVRHVILQFANRGITEFLFGTVLDDILARGGITAIVAESDALAETLIQQCERRNLSSTPAFIGFDNSPESFRSLLTTWDFDFEHAASLVFSSIMRPKLFGRDTTRHREVKGVPVERETTG